MSVTGYAIEYQIFFIIEQRYELYIKYCSGVAQRKKIYDAKSTFQRYDLLGLERCGA